MNHTARSLLLLLGALGALVACSGGPTETSDAATTADANTPGADAAAARCAPSAACERVGDCLAEVDQTGVAEPALRIAQLTLEFPASLSTGIIRSTFAGAFLPSEPTCNLPGTATANWILQFTDDGGFRIGAARPRASEPYAFIDEMMGTLTVAPQTTTLSGSTALESAPVDIVLPVFLDAAATQAIVLPLHALRVTMTPDASRTCVGSYNAEGLDPANDCLPDSETAAFREGGTLQAYISLEDADKVIVGTLMQSLCVLLSGDPAMYGDGATPASLCRRTDGAIDFEGDWCSTTSSAATADCHDAARFSASFAASGVEVL